ncbi:MAG: 2OG-Fe(II) oxygenase, partial [Acinetobacter sp.]|uniref:2OG-Fe(II) oxygenase n=1 Tax=Acinetobacter sp. TaxID=472 RepID=UPI00257B6156
MDAIQLPKSCNVDQIIDDLDQQGFSIIDDIYTQDYVNALVKECSAHLNSFREAAIQNGVIQTIRNDQILWIDPKLPIAQQHIATLNQISERLNQYFYLGLKEVEAHFACYNSGNFYALHRDNPQQKNNRVISTVYYLHERWQADW